MIRSAVINVPYVFLYFNWIEQCNLFNLFYLSFTYLNVLNYSLCSFYAKYIQFKFQNLCKIFLTEIYIKFLLIKLKRKEKDRFSFCVLIKLSLFMCVVHSSIIDHYKTSHLSSSLMNCKLKLKHCKMWDVIMKCLIR